MSAAFGPAMLDAPEAYRIWAACYDAENAVTALEDAGVRRVTPPLRGRALLDVGCGTGRRLPGGDHGLSRRAGIDLVFEMLAAGKRSERSALPLAAGDVVHLPVRAALFDTLWCRLVLGHMLEPGPAYAELGRVATPGATLIMTDFHPEAAAAGHTRSFRAAGGQLVTVTHHSHTPAAHVAAAASAGWTLRERVDLRVGPQVHDFYERAGALERYRAQIGLPLVLLLVFQR